MQTTESQTDIPDSATTAKDSLYQDVALNGDGSGLSKEDDIAIDPLDRAQSGRQGSLAPTERDEDEDRNYGDETLEKHPSQARDVWKFHLRPADDEEPEDWWFASTAIPLLAATFGPMANILSIAALVTAWREKYSDAAPGVDEDAVPYDDPRWCVVLNAISLVCGFVGNLFLLFNFTRAVRYIVALPLTIILWFFATGILMAITICMHIYTPAKIPAETYSQGYWHAVMAAGLYFICSTLLVVNLYGYFLGHYPQHFDLTDEQRNLILQTMMFFFWLAAGAGIFSRAENWSFVDALYFCDVTILTIGFGDFFPDNDLGRGLIFPYTVGGIIILGLVVSSISKFAHALAHDKVIKKNLEKRRAATASRTVTSSTEAEQREQLGRALMNNEGKRPRISMPFNPQRRTIAFDTATPDVRSIKSPKSVRSAYARSMDAPSSPKSWISNLSHRTSFGSIRSSTFKNRASIRRVTSRSTKLKMLRDERDRFNEMRRLQFQTKQFKKYFSLSMSLACFATLWCVGAMVFMFAENGETYFEALYFCYVSLLTIGYGDLAPRSNAGKPFFIVWSLCAVPTMTILISNMGDTIIASYKQGTFNIAEWTVLPREGLVRHALDRHPKAFGWLSNFITTRQEKSRIEKGFPIGPDSDTVAREEANLEALAEEKSLDHHDLAHRLTIAIRTTADDLKAGIWRNYSYEEWVEFTRLIRFTQYKKGHRHQLTASELDEEEIEEGIVEWDWIGEDSPMMADVSETEWVLDRLCESLDRYMRQQVPVLQQRRRERRRSRFGSQDAGIPQVRAGVFDDGQEKEIEAGMGSAGFSPIPLSSAEGPRRRGNSRRASRSRSKSPGGTRRGRNVTLAPPEAFTSGGARSPPAPGVPRRSMDGALSDDNEDDDSVSDYDSHEDELADRPTSLRPLPTPHNQTPSYSQASYTQAPDSQPGPPFPRALLSPQFVPSDSEPSSSRQRSSSAFSFLRRPHRPTLPSAWIASSANSASSAQSENSRSGSRNRSSTAGDSYSSKRQSQAARKSRPGSTIAGNRSQMQSLTAMRLRRG